ncbi:hypothetical protein ACEWPL_013270 [Roseovarius sp. S1116L3]|uniref:hypothetical protein n=1 Tax=Roseovarius roseus TaxID=3342636 RepID=UPI0037286747
MWFDAQAALARMGGDDAPLATYVPPNANEGRLAGIAEIAGTRSPDLGNLPSAAPASWPYGVSAGVRPLTYTGRVVSLDAWRNLTGWEKDGPKGRAWDGLSGEWIEMGKGKT